MLCPYAYRPPSGPPLGYHILNPINLPLLVPLDVPLLSPFCPPSSIPIKAHRYRYRYNRKKGSIHIAVD